MYYNIDAFKVGWRMWLVITVTVLALWGSVGFIITKLTDSADNYEEVRPNPPVLDDEDIAVHNLYHAAMVIEGPDMTEEVIDTGMENTIVVVSFHFYDDYESLTFDYNTLYREDGEPEQDLWGWSNCEWQPDANAAFCDIYTVRPRFVHGDMAMDTIGHEVWHGVAGGFHE